MTSFDAETFKGCSSLTSIEFPNNVTTIGDYAFEDCSGLTSVTIPPSVTTIKRDAFWKCSGLKYVYITDLAAWCNIDFTGGDANPLFYTKRLFLNNEEVKDLVIPDGVTTIKDITFYDCRGLTSVTIPSSVTSIGFRAFMFCSGLTSVSIGNGVTSIGDEAFYGADIPVVVSLVEDPFKINSETFSNNTFQNATLYVPTGTKDKYKSLEGWKNFVYLEEGNVKCEAPTISYMDGQLAFESATVGAVCQWTITDEDIKMGSGNLVDLTATYHVTAYATRPGWDNSEIVEATLCWIETEPTQGIATEKIEIPAFPVLIKSREGVVTVEGLADGTLVSLYATDGSLIGSATSYGKIATVNTTLKKDTIVIVRIGEKAVKVVMK